MTRMFDFGGVGGCVLIKGVRTDPPFFHVQSPSIRLISCPFPISTTHLVITQTTQAIHTSTAR